MSGTTVETQTASCSAGNVADALARPSSTPLPGSNGSGTNTSTNTSTNTDANTSTNTDSNTHASALGKEGFFVEKRKILQSKLHDIQHHLESELPDENATAILHSIPYQVAKTVSLGAERAERGISLIVHAYSSSPSPLNVASPAGLIKKEPLSLKFIHKPSRAKEFYKKCIDQDQTKLNSIFNSFSLSPTTELSQNPFTTTDTETETTSAISQDEDEDDELAKNGHTLIRKKSGEVLKPLLKDSSIYSYFNRKRTQSLPTTPTYKQVHFGGLSNVDVDIRYFKKKDRPAAISATNSPTLDGSNNDFHYNTDEEFENTNYDDSESDSDFDADYMDEQLASELVLNLDLRGSTKFVRSTPNSTGAGASSQIDWDLKLPNFPILSYDAKIAEECNVFLERMFISIDKKHLLGHIAVKNLVFEKCITVRYTLDNWDTIIEVPTTYVPDIPQILKKNKYDRFIFKIPLNNLFNSFTTSTQPSLSATKSFQLCIKYIAATCEFWDNNNFNNYEFRLTKLNKIEKKEKSAAPPQKLESLESHTSKPRYSSSYLKRRLSDSTLEVHHPPQPLHGGASPDVFFDYTTSSPSTSSKIVGTNNSPFNYNFAFSNASNLSIDNPPYLISPILSLQKNPKKVNENFKLPPSSYDDPLMEDSASNGNENKNPKKFTPSTEFGKLSSKARNVLDAKSYKELLDTYCFFSKPTPDIQDVHTHDKENGNLSTVSSILGLHQ